MDGFEQRWSGMVGDELSTSLARRAHRQIQEGGGLTLADGAIPIDPARPAARSDKISPCCHFGSAVEPKRGSENGAHQIGARNDVQRLRVLDHPHRHSIHEHLIPLDIREILGDDGSSLVPQDQTTPLSVGFRDESEELAGSRGGQLESPSKDTLASVYRRSVSAHG